MADKSNKFSRFWQELKRRKTDRVIVIYVATAFAILQLVNDISPALSLPDWITTFIIILLGIGFPLTIIFSWFFDITPGGIEKTKPVSDKKKHTKESEIRTWKGATLISIIVIIGLLLFNIVRGGIGSNEIKNLEKTIAVIPFRCWSDDDRFSYLGDAIPDEINTSLTKIRGFHIISATSTIAYKNQDKLPVKQIARKLGVNFIIEGSVELLKEVVTINIQIIIAKYDDHIWAEKFSDKLDNIQALRTNICNMIAEQLKIKLSPSEIEQIEKKQTNNFNAYSRYLSGNTLSDEARYFFTRGNMYADSTSFEKAIANYDIAIEYDTLFALAYAKRAIAYSWYYYTWSKNPENIVKCKEDVDKALEIDPELTEAQIAMGFYYYYCMHDYPEALKHFKKAVEKNPENWEPVFYMALVHRRYGNWAMSQSLMPRVLKYNPQDALILTNIGLSYDYLRNYDSALIFHEKALKVMPNWESPYINKIETLIRKSGSTTEARLLMDTAIVNTGNNFIKLKIMLDTYDRRFKEALTQTEKILNKTDLSDGTFLKNRGEKLLFCAMLNNYLDIKTVARTYFDSSRIYFEKQLIKYPENPTLFSNLGISYAGMRNRLKAIEAGEKALNLTKDNVLQATETKESMAQIYTMLGDFENALRYIDDLLLNPSLFSLKLLQVNPVWKPILFLPEFQGLLIKYSKL